MRKRLLVMNKQCIIQRDHGGEWVNQKVEKAGSLKPGIYNIFNAEKAEPNKSYEGIIVHKGDKNLFQKVGKKFVMHEQKKFDIMPIVGSEARIGYGDNGNAEVAKMAKGAKRKFTR